MMEGAVVAAAVGRCRRRMPADGNGRHGLPPGHRLVRAGETR
jgi:hypothetical protein